MPTLPYQVTPKPSHQYDAHSACVVVVVMQVMVVVVSDGGFHAVPARL